MKNTLETRLGIYFVLVAFAGVLLLELSGIGLFKRGYTLHGDFLSVQELKAGDPVKMAGVQVGRVEKIGFHENKVRVSMRLTREHQIRTDSIATVKFTGLMGQNFVSLSLGSAVTHFQHDDVLKTTEQADLSSLIARLDDVASGVENLTKSFSGDSIQNILGPMTDFLKQNNPRFAILFANLQRISQEIADGKGTVGKLISDDTLHRSLLASSQDFQAASKDLRGLVPDTRAALGEAKSTLAEARSTISTAKETVNDAKKVVGEINEGKGTLGKLAKDEALYRETTQAMTSLREILQKINQGQGSIGKLVNDDSLFKNAKMTLQKVDKATEGLEDQGPLSVLGLLFSNGLF
jgi:phospholipid/cholesterol/gamma-HCH transport system substrate-binding protein